MGPSFTQFVEFSDALVRRMKQARGKAQWFATSLLYDSTPALAVSGTVRRIHQAHDRHCQLVQKGSRLKMEQGT